MSLSAALSPTPFGRLLTAMVTPFDADGRVDLALAGRLARHLVDEGSDGLVVCGTTGESPTLSWQEQVQLLEAVRQAVGSGVKVLAGTGSNSTAEAVEATREAAAAGANGGALLQQASTGLAGGPFPGRGRGCPRVAVDALQHPRSHRLFDGAVHGGSTDGLRQRREFQGRQWQHR